MSSNIVSEANVSVNTLNAKETSGRIRSLSATSEQLSLLIGLVLLEREIINITDLKATKIGDGKTAYKDLPYLTHPGFGLLGQTVNGYLGIFNKFAKVYPCDGSTISREDYPVFFETCLIEEDTFTMPKAPYMFMYIELTESFENFSNFCNI